MSQTLGHLVLRRSALCSYIRITLVSLILALAPLLTGMAQEAHGEVAGHAVEQGTQVSGSQQAQVLVAVENATGRLAARLIQIAASWPEVASAPAEFWRWLTQDGADPMAPLRSTASAVVLIGLGWLVQTTAAHSTTKSVRRWTPSGAIHPGRAEAAIMVLRWFAFLGTVGAAHALVPEASRQSRLATLALILTFAGTWIGSRAVARALPALLSRGHKIVPATVRVRLLDAALVILFAGMFGLVLLREAGLSADARLVIGMAAWLPFSALLLAAFRPLGGPLAANDATDPGTDYLERFVERHGLRLIRPALLTLVIVTPIMALIYGPAALSSGIASFALLAVTVAALALARTSVPTSAHAERASQSLWPLMLRRALRILILTAFALSLVSVWDIDLLDRANAQLGETVVRGVMTVGVTVVLAYLTWEVIRTALAESVLGPPRPAGERGEEGGGVAATRLQTFAPVLRNFLFVAVITVATLVGLAALGLNITPLLAGAGVIGIALGFGAQTLVRDVISGVFFLAEDAFRIGEYVSIGNTRGTVESIAIRSLRIRHHRGPVHTVPFGEIKQLTNYSRDWLIMKLEFLLAFDTDLRKVKNVVKEIGKELHAHPELGHAILESVKSQGVRRMEPTGMVVGIKFMAKPGSEAYVLRREVYQRVRDAFEQNGIRFARPEVFVAGSGPAAASAAAVGAPSGADRLAQAT